ncbi:MAG: hypothetical protein WBA57_10390 [Elainellaceae cyanobacterium]
MRTGENPLPGQPETFFAPGDRQTEESSVGDRSEGDDNSCLSACRLSAC